MTTILEQHREALASDPPVSEIAAETVHDTALPMKAYQLLILVLLSLGIAVFLYSLTGYFVEDFIRQFII